MPDSYFLFGLLLQMAKYFPVEEVKDTRRAQVHITYDGRVCKTFKGHQAKERFENEVLVLQYLGKKACPFVPRLLKEIPEKLYLETTNCGKIVEQLTAKKQAALFEELEAYGVRHEDADKRNVTYDHQSGRFNIIDFEFATILDDPDQVSPVAWPHEREAEDRP
ncbi:MAG: serine/threonine protein phosphatase [Verrucomicrobiota bacterium]